MNWFRCLSATLLTSALCAPASATVHNVSTATQLDTVLHSVSLADGDLVKVAAGTYTLSSWSPVVLQARITLVGEGLGVTVIDGPGLGSLEFIKVRSAGLTVRDLTLTDFESPAIFIKPEDVNNNPLDQELTLERVEVTNSGGGVVAALGTGRLRRVEVRDCRFADLTGIAVHVGTHFLESALVTGNSIRGAGIAGIWLGGDGALSQLDDYAQHLIVSHNDIRGIVQGQLEEGGFDMAKGIYAAGRDVVIQGNTIADFTVPRCDPTCRDAVNGIYTKANRAVISGNTIRDPGPGYGITIKGRDRGATTSDPPGFNNLVTNNQIFYTPQSGKKYTGINVTTSDVTVNGNHVEGANEYGVQVQTGAADDVSITDNALFLAGGGSGSGEPWGVLVRKLNTQITPRYLLITQNRIVGANLAIHHLSLSGMTWSAAAIPGDWVTTPNLVH